MSASARSGAVAFVVGVRSRSTSSKTCSMRTRQSRMPGQRAAHVGTRHRVAELEPPQHVGAEATRVVREALAVQAGGLGADEQRRDPRRIVGAVQVDVHDLRPEAGEDVRCGLRVLGDGRVDVLEEEPAGQSHAQAGDAGVQTGPRIVERVLDGVRVVAVVPGHHREHLGDVGDRPRHRADRVERGADRERAPGRHQPVGGPQRAHAVERRRDADGAAGVGPERAEAQVGAERGARAAAGAARDAVGVPRVAAGAEVRVVGRRAVGELVQRDLAEDDGARGAQAPHDLRVLVGDAVGEEPRAARRPARRRRRCCP